VASSLIFWAVVIKSNTRLPNPEKIRIYIFYSGVILNVRRKYKELYPGGKLAFLLNLSFVGIALAFLAGARKVWPHQMRMPEMQSFLWAFTGTRYLRHCSHF